MRRRISVSVALAAAAVAAMLCGGCGPVVKQSELPRKFEAPEYLSDTVGTAAFFTGADPVLVQGIGLVTGLRGTGSKTLPPGLKVRMMKILGQNNVPRAESLLADPSTAVVFISGFIMPGALENEPFDLAVAAAPGTETTSLEGGRLMPADLARLEPTRTGTVAGSRLAIGAGETFVSPFTAGDRPSSASGSVRPIGPTDKPAPAVDDTRPAVDPRLAWIIGGGRVLATRRFMLNLLEPGERVADQIVTHINARFPDAAKGRAQPGIIDFHVPPEYAHQKRHFLDVVGATYLVNSPTRREERQRLLVAKLIEGPDRVPVSAALEAFGKSVLTLVEPLANHADPAVRYYAADLMARMNQPNIMPVLEAFVRDDASPFQERAVASLAELQGGVAAGIIRGALDARSPTVRIAAYLALRRIAPNMLAAKVLPGRMELAAIRSQAEPFVFVARSLEPRVIVFGDVRLKPPVFVDTDRLLVSAQPGDAAVTLINKRFGVAGKIEAPLAVAEVIRILAGPPMVDANHPRPQGLDLSYADVVAFLDRAKMQGALAAPLVYEPIQIVTPDTGDGQGDTGTGDIIIPER